MGMALAVVLAFLIISNIFSWVKISTLHNWNKNLKRELGDFEQHLKNINSRLSYVDKFEYGKAEWGDYSGCGYYSYKDKPSISLKDAIQYIYDYLGIEIKETPAKEKEFSVCLKESKNVSESEDVE